MASSTSSTSFFIFTSPAFEGGEIRLPDNALARRIITLRKQMAFVAPARHWSDAGEANFREISEEYHSLCAEYGAGAYLL